MNKKISLFFGSIAIFSLPIGLILIVGNQKNDPKLKNREIKSRTILNASQFDWSEKSINEVEDKITKNWIIANKDSLFEGNTDKLLFENQVEFQIKDTNNETLVLWVIIKAGASYDKNGNITIFDSKPIEITINGFKKRTLTTEEILNVLASNSSFQPKKQFINDDVSSFTPENLIKKIEWKEEKENPFNLVLGDNEKIILSFSIQSDINFSKLQEEIFFIIIFNAIDKSNDNVLISKQFKKSIKGWTYKLNEIINSFDSKFLVDDSKKMKLPSELTKEEIEWQKPNAYKNYDIKFIVFDLEPNDVEGIINFKSKIIVNDVEVIKENINEEIGFWNNQLVEFSILNNSISARDFDENPKTHNKRNSVFLKLKAKSGMIASNKKSPSIYLNNENENGLTIKNYGINAFDDQNGIIELYSLNNLKPGDTITIKMVNFVFILVLV